MAQPIRSQPPRACRHPALFYSEPDLEEIESNYAEVVIKMALDGKKRKRNQSRPRATSPEPTTQPETVVVRKPPLKVNKKLWRRLHPDLVEGVLNHLPVSTLWHTVMAINPTRWKQIVSNNGCTNVLGHGNHVDSCIGYIKSYISLFRSNRLPEEDDLRPPPPRALDHATQIWQSLPRYPESNVRKRLKVQSVSEGLILMVMPEHGFNFANHNSGYLNRHRMVIWNPVSQSRRWLPKSPLGYNDQNLFYCTEALVVDRERSGYRVIEFVQSVVQAANPIARGPRHVPYRPEQLAISGYTVYDSVSASWGAIQPQPGNISEMRLNSPKTSISCEGCVCFVNVQRQSTKRPGWELPVAIVCYDPSTDVWSEVSFPTRFFNRLPGYHTGCLVQELLYARGKVYMIFTRSPRAQLYTHYIVSIALVDLQSGVAAFEHVGRVREAERSANSTSPYLKHAPPKCWQSKPNELILQRPCGRSCIHRWYMLPVGSTVYLCVVVCGRWHKRFDLHAGVWTDLLMEVPCDKKHDLKVKTTILPSGTLYYWDTKYHPYNPGWIKV